MISSSLFVLLLATYAYSIPVGENLNIQKQFPQVTSPQSAILHLLDDGDSTNVANLIEPTSATVLGRLPLTTQNSYLNNNRGIRGMLETSTSDSLFETSPKSVLRPRGVEDSWTTVGSTVESSTLSGFRPRGVEDSWTTVGSKIESSTLSGFGPRGIEETSPLYSTMLETTSQFNDRKIRGEKNVLDMDLQTTEEPSSSVTSFATTTGFLRGIRGEQSEDLESSSMQMDDSTTDFSSTGRSKTVIEVFAGPNTKTEIIPGSNVKTEVMPGENTKTEIISESGDKTEIIRSGSNKLVGGKQPLSEGQN